MRLSEETIIALKIAGAAAGTSPQEIARHVIDTAMEEYQEDVTIILERLAEREKRKAKQYETR